jgi:hypothetical protein
MAPTAFRGRAADQISSGGFLPNEVERANLRGSLQSDRSSHALAQSYAGVFNGKHAAVTAAIDTPLR